MTLGEITSAVLEEIGYSKTGAGRDVTVRIRRRVNDWHRRLLSRPGLLRFFRESFAVTFTTTSGTATYGLPPAVGRISGIWETTNDVKLGQRSVDWLRKMDPGASAVGVPEVYVPMGIAPVHTQPSDASTLYVKSSSVSDTDITVTLRYLDSSGVSQTDTDTLTGTTALALGSDVVEVHHFSVAPAPQGTVTLYEDSDGGTTLASIPANETMRRYLRLQLWPTPQSAITYRVDAIRETADLIEEFDEPLLPRDFHYLLVLGATADEMRMRDDSRYEVVRVDMEQGQRDLMNWVWNNVDHVPSGGEAAAPSRLGAWFPAGS